MADAPNNAATSKDPIKPTTPAKSSAPKVQIGMTAFMGHGRLNPKLMAQITTTDDMQDNSPIVVGLVEDGEFSVESQYSTPFENSNPEGRFGNLMGMIQSGHAGIALGEVMQSAGQSQANNANASTMDKVTGFAMNIAGTTVKSVNDLSGMEKTLEGLKGKSSFTKVNSQQIFTSSSSLKISCTLVFSAWADAKKEVEAAVQKLQEWTLPVKLADKTAIEALVTGGKVLDSIFSSVIPPTVSLTYGGKTYSPLVIESMSAPMVAPMNASGDRIAVKCQLSLVSLTAWDKDDVIKLYA